MKIAFVHQNMPAQYKSLAKHFAADPGNQCVFITKRKNVDLPRVRRVNYETTRKPTQGIHHYLRLAEDQVLHGQAVFRKFVELKQRGFVPEIVLAHSGWGEALFIKDVFPDAPLLTFCEYFYRAFGSDFEFDRDRPIGYDDLCRIRMKNTTMSMTLLVSDWGLSPTRWQWEQHPPEFRSKISVIHDGIDTEVCRPDPQAELTLPNGRVLHQGEEVVTYIVRNLEPYRGFPTFMRAVEEVCRRRPAAEIVIVGGDETSYGAKLPDGQTYRGKMLAEVDIDSNRVHFLGRVPYNQFLRILQVSAVHVYLTYPFVLSWSMLEAMSCGCLVVGSNTPPVEEVIEDGVNGLIVDFHSPREIADRIDEVLDHSDRMASIRDSARRTILERYDLKNVCLPAQLKLIDDLLQGRTPQTDGCHAEAIPTPR